MPRGCSQDCAVSGGLVQARPGPPEVSRRAQRGLLGLSCRLSRPSVSLCPAWTTVGRGPGSGGCLRSSRSGSEGWSASMSGAWDVRGNGSVGGREAGHGEARWGARGGPALPLTCCHGPGGLEADTRGQRLEGPTQSWARSPSALPTELCTPKWGLYGPSRP